jgi:hypothetical protein
MKHDSYFYDRAEQELECAQGATHPAAVKAHYLLASYYLDQFYGSAEAALADPAPRLGAITRNIKGE